MLPAITDLSAALGLSATPDESAEMLTIVLGLFLILAGGGIVAACVDGFVAADRTADRAGQSEPQPRTPPPPVLR